MIESILKSPVNAAVGRVLLTFVFWAGGLHHLLDFQGTVAMMHAFGVEPAEPFTVLAVVVLLGGSALVIADRWTWLGAGALATFTVLTIPVAHPVWRLVGEARELEIRVVLEHISLIGGLIFVAIASRRRSTQAGPFPSLQAA